MKKILFITLILSATFINAQNEDIEKRILNYDDSKSTIISKGRNMLIDKFIEKDIESVKEIRRYLMEDVENKNYISLYPVENWLILYWTNEYNDLLDDIKSLDSLRMAEYDAKIQPNKDLLYLKLKEASVENAETIKSQINESGLSSEYKMFLTLNYENLIADVQADEYIIDKLNNSAEIFLSAYPNSEYTDFTRKHIRYKLMTSDWGFGYEFYLGYGIFTGSLSDH